MIEIRKTEIFNNWFNKIKDGKTQAIINKHIARFYQKNMGDSKPVGGGISELRIDYGKGFRIYYKKKHDIIIIILCSGDKSTQAEDIKNAHKILKELEE